MTVKSYSAHSIALANRCDPNALAANRQGRMTAKQRVQLMLSALPIIFVMLLTVFWLLYLIRAQAAMSELIGVSALSIFSMYFWRSGLLRLIDAQQGTVRRVRGSIEKQESSGEYDLYWYCIDGLHLEVGKRGYEALESDHVYVVYYSPRSKRLMNIEPYTTGVQDEHFKILS